MPPVSRETMQQVLDLIGRDAAAGKVEVETPTRNLESYFLEVVRKARENLSETSGATSGSTVAAYLRGDAEAPPASDKILERLTVSNRAQARCARRACRARPAPLTKPSWKAWPTRPPRPPSPSPCPLRPLTWARPTKNSPPCWEER